MTVGYLASGFDLLNVRDLDLVAQAAERCDSLVLGVLTDDLVERLQGRRPVVPLVERMALVSHLRGVAQVVEHPDLVVPAPVRDDVRDLVCFVATDEPAIVVDLDHVGLAPRRTSASEVLRTALRPVTAADEQSEAVA